LIYRLFSGVPSPDIRRGAAGADAVTAAGAFARLARRAHRPVPYTTMITLPAGACPDGLVLVTTCPRRACLPATLNPSPMSTSRALTKSMPITSGIGTMTGLLAAGELTVTLALGVAAREAEGELAGGAAAEADAELGRDAAAAGVVAAAACRVGGEAVALPAACGEAWNRSAMIDPARSRAATPAIAAMTGPRRRGRPPGVRASAGRVTEMVAAGWPVPMAGPGPSTGWPGPG